ncbi:hypothetical protein VNO77_03608 [Canavalia gladiata]|uniref:Uncharacterized protein n=1 Tax=Canavalia gladiata TaxID=3824 RepID=A0AAN9N0N8_CANGL
MESSLRKGSRLVRGNFEKMGQNSIFSEAGKFVVLSELRLRHVCDNIWYESEKGRGRATAKNADVHKDWGLMSNRTSSLACAAEEVQEWCSNPTPHNFDFKVLFQVMCASHAGKWTSPLMCQAHAPHMTMAKAVPEVGVLSYRYTNWAAPNLVIRASSIGAQQTQGRRKVS